MLLLLPLLLLLQLLSRLLLWRASRC